MGDQKPPRITNATMVTDTLAKAAIQRSLLQELPRHGHRHRYTCMNEWLAENHDPHATPPGYLLVEGDDELVQLCIAVEVMTQRALAAEDEVEALRSKMEQQECDQYTLGYERAVKDMQRVLEGLETVEVCDE